MALIMYRVGLAIYIEMVQWDQSGNVANLPVWEVCLAELMPKWHRRVVAISPCFFRFIQKIFPRGCIVARPGRGLV